MSPSIEIANIIAPLVNVIFLLFGGTFQPSPPPWFVWLKWISPINYTFSALAQNEFEGREVRCDSGAGGGQEAGASGACYGSVSCVE
jgi:ABC-type multidrug transport system permease subunit